MFGNTMVLDLPHHLVILPFLLLLMHEIQLEVWQLLHPALLLHDVEDNTLPVWDWVQFQWHQAPCTLR